VDMYLHPIRLHAVVHNSFCGDFCLFLVKFKVLTALAVTIVVFWDMTPCTFACCIQRNARSVLVGKPEERRLFGIPVNRWDFILTL